MPLYMFLHNLLNVLVQIANKMGLQKNTKTSQFIDLLPIHPHTFQPSTTFIITLPPTLALILLVYIFRAAALSSTAT
jgi:hypothetical protein